MVKKNIIKLTLDDAKIIAEGAEEKAREIGVPMDIAVVDDGGNLLLFHRMEMAKLTSIDIAINKAYTSAGTRKGTHEYRDIASPGGPAFGIHTSNQGRFTIFGGGLPIFIEGQLVGAIGCSSGTPEEDIIVAKAGIERLLKVLKERGDIKE